MANDDKSTPWWHSSAAFAAVATTLLAVLGGIVSATSATVSHFEKNRELELERDKQLHELRLAYLDRLEKPLLRKQVLQFITMSDYDPALKTWANGELVTADQEVAVLRKEIDSDQQGERQLQATVETLDAKVRAATSTTADTAPKPAVNKSATGAIGDGKIASHGKSDGQQNNVDAKRSAKLEDDLARARVDLERRRAAVDAKRSALGISPMYQQAPVATPPSALLFRQRRALAE